MVTAPRRLRRPAPRREAPALRIAAKMRRSGFALEHWQVDALKRIYDRYGSLDIFQKEVLAIKAQLRYAVAGGILKIEGEPTS